MCTLKNSFDDQCNNVTMEEEWLTVVDCASSTAVAEVMEDIKWEKNGRRNEFGGRERRSSQGTIFLHCNCGEMVDIRIRTDVVDADLPLLIGNPILKWDRVKLDFRKKKMELMSIKMKLQGTNSGHGSISLNYSMIKGDDN